MSEDLFIRRIYTYSGISVAVNIDLIAKTVSLVEKNGNDSFRQKNWYFTDRGLEYMNGWLLILDAMKHAITEASKVLKEVEDRDQERFVKLLTSLNDTAVKLKDKQALKAGK